MSGILFIFPSINFKF
uniref:Uncharacterized protein n=1 Tax=Rhizophora mucronata TaxID=61149 RepID=A0A2P2IJJ2_RHIMU